MKRLVGIVRAACIKYLHRTFEECTLETVDLWLLVHSYIDEYESLLRLEREVEQLRWRS